MAKMDMNKITAQFKKDYPEAGIEKVEYTEGDNKASFHIRPNKKALAMLDNTDALKSRMAQASTITRNTLDRTLLDLGAATSPYNEDPQASYKRSMTYYHEDDVYGSVIDALTNFSSKGFENDIDDPDIKAFYDTWAFDVDFKQVIDWIFFEFFRTGLVRTYKIVGKYEPGITYMNPTGKSPAGTTKKQTTGFLKAVAKKAELFRKKQLRKISAAEKEYKDNADFLVELAAKKKMWSKGYMPTAYTVLNPLLIELEGSLLFNKSKTLVQPSDELKKLFQKNPSELTDDEKEIIKLLPSEFKAQLEAGGSIILDPLYVGAVDYRKQPYERYPRPRGIKAFESIEYKRRLREADISTLDGISNYILKITIGNDEFPVTDTSQLETVAQLFNTPSKSFDVVWNHTLEIEKIVSPEIDAILGQGKYSQVNMDITGGLAMSRAFFDGVGDNSDAEVGLVTKTVREEIAYARRKVTNWIYDEYRLIAEAAGFDRFPKVRWDQTVLRDDILYMTTIATLVDRRMLSYETALEELGFDYENELNNMTNELALVEEGIFGIIGSPFQQSATQPTGAPKGTPSGGRPKGKVAGPKKKSTDTNKQTKQPKISPSQQPKSNKKAASVSEAVSDMSDEAYDEFLKGLAQLRLNRDTD